MYLHNFFVSTDSVVAYMSNSNITPILIPDGYTSSFHPQDVSLNKPLKESYKKQWGQWFKNREPVMTTMGNRQRPSYVNLVVEQLS